MNYIFKGILALILIISTSDLYAQDPTNIKKDTSCFQSSSIANVGSFFFNGDYSVFSAGFGFGVSYKIWTRHHGYPWEIGFYIAPQVAGTKQGDVAFVSALLHLTCMEAFGVGIGYKFWNKGEGFISAYKNTLFFTLGYNLTNEKP